MTAGEPEHVGPHPTPPPGPGLLLDRTPSRRARSGPRGESDARSGDRGAYADIEVRQVDAAHGVIITVAGPLESVGAAALGKHLGAELDRGLSVIVVDLSHVPTCEPIGVEILASARHRARLRDVTMHLVHLGAPDARRWLTESGLG
ncbi:STAS domain-containing protein [Actinomycetospora sp. CA-101289]|uniref:STAS domain-containing protein n=1 Tax=Actinomycetospora sp. CA-101289 TaxID=3239893 RepID=UPI003D97E4F8